MSDEDKKPEGPSLPSASSQEVKTITTFERTLGRPVSGEALTQILEGQTAPSGEQLARDVHKSFENALAEECEKAASAIETAVANGDYRLAYAAVDTAEATGLLELGGSEALFQAILKIKGSALDRPHARRLLEAVMKVGSQRGRHDLLEKPAEEYLKLFRGELEPDHRHDVLLVLANGAAQSGKRQSAIARFEELLAEGSQVASAKRGFAHQGLALLLADHPDGMRHQQLALDAFLQANRRLDAVRRMIGLAKQRSVNDLNGALAMLKQAFELANGLDPPVRLEVVATLHHVTAQILFKVYDFQNALANAQEAAALRSGLIGREIEQAESLMLAATCAHALGLRDVEKAFRDAEATIPHPQVSARREIMNALETGQPLSAQFVAQLEAGGDDLLRVLLRIWQAVRGPETSLASKLKILDEAEAIIRAHTLQKIGPGVRTLLLNAYAQAYLNADQLEKALSYYEQLLARDPRDKVTAKKKIFILRKLNRLPEVVQLLQKQVELFGMDPYLMTMLGMAQRQAGQAHAAAATLHQAQKISRSPQLIAVAEMELQSALDQASGHVGATPNSGAIQQPDVTVANITLDHCEAKLWDFVKFIQSQRRMDFWQQKGTGHQWVPRPERLACSLLDTFLNGHFGKVVESLQEVGAGAGRIDLYLRFVGGLAIVVELKMCGGGYSTTYALEGIGQLEHYMQNRGTGLGYLLVFDGRSRDFGKGVTDQEASIAGLIRTRVIDVRPTVRHTVAK